MTRNPRHCYLAIRDQSYVPDTDAERTLYVTLHGEKALNKVTPLRKWGTEEDLDPSLAYPINVFRDATTRAVLEAFLLATNDNNYVSLALAMPAEEVDIYRKLFFDTSVFRTDLDIMVYLNQLPEDSSELRLYKIAYHQGVESLRWHFCRDKGVADPDAVMRTVMTDSYYRYLEHRGLPATHTLAKEAMKNSKVALDCAKTLAENTVNADTEGLQIKFEEVRRNRTVEQLMETGISEILH